MSWRRFSLFDCDACAGVGAEAPAMAVVSAVAIVEERLTMPVKGLGSQQV